MATKSLNLLGLPCPQPTLKMTIEANSCKPGDIIEAVADCPTFADDVKSWCQRMRKTLLWVKDEGGGKKRVQVQL
ncbi:MAG: SirA-like protein [Candidatus Margulisbacteria bacterium GWF2_35_9]|nr:MAG: SirA-like protein [Candidatus Margulisbacteria bacterium GWF2_35_9]